MAPGGERRGPRLRGARPPPRRGRRRAAAAGIFPPRGWSSRWPSSATRAPPAWRGSCGWATRGRSPPAGGRCSPAWPSRSLPRTCPTRPRCSPRPGPGPPAWWPTRSGSPCRAGRCTWDGCSRSAGVRYVVVVDGLAPSMVGTGAAVGRARRRQRGSIGDLLQQDDLQVVPGVLGVQVFENGEHMPVTAERAAPLPPVAHVVVSRGGGRGGLAARARARCRGAGPPPARSRPAPLYAGYAPAGSFALSVGGRAAPRRPAFGWAAQYPVTPGPASLTLSQFPFVPLVVLLELAAWVVLAVALLGRPRRARAHRVAAHGAGRSREPGPPQPRAPVARCSPWWSLVVAGVGIAAGTRGTSAPAAAPAVPSALVERAQRGVVGLVLHGPVHRRRASRPASSSSPTRPGAPSPPPSPR